MSLKKSNLYIALLIGILILVIAIPSKNPDRTKRLSDKEEGLQDESRDDTTSEKEYVRDLEKRLKDTLEQVEGVGKSDVMITLKTKGQSIVEKDYRSVKSNTDEEDSAGGKRTVSDNDLSKESIYVRGNDGEEIPYVSKEITPEISGILIVCQGGGNPAAVKSITEAVQALFGVEAHKIKIMKRTKR